jgi:ornithine cyclodeaminase/alanine dehydrogenase-like protein (mu-crystallin family)
MKILIVSGSDVHELLGYGECAEVLRAALAARARGEVYQPLRTVIRPADRAGLMALMPAYWPGTDPGYGLKAICIFGGNPAIGLDAHQGVVLLSSTRTGEPLAILNASAITEIRTAAVSAVATGLLARPDATELAIIGTGVQARAHLLAISGSRPLTAIRVAGRDHAKAARFADLMQATAGVPVIACASAREAVAGAGLIVTATSAAEPVLQRGWLAAGAHINAVGACLPHTRELDSATMAAAALFADSRESVRGEAGDYLLALAEGAIGPGHVRAEIGELLTGAAAGRSSDQEITVFESLGLAVEDLAAAAYVYGKASRLGAGVVADF